SRLDAFVAIIPLHPIIDRDRSSHIAAGPDDWKLASGSYNTKATDRQHGGLLVTSCAAKHGNKNEGGYIMVSQQGISRRRMLAASAAAGGLALSSGIPDLSGAFAQGATRIDQMA